MEVMAARVLKVVGRAGAVEKGVRPEEMVGKAVVEVVGTAAEPVAARAVATVGVLRARPPMIDGTQRASRSTAQST